MVSLDDIDLNRFYHVLMLYYDRDGHIYEG